MSDDSRGVLSVHSLEVAALPTGRVRARDSRLNVEHRVVHRIRMTAITTSYEYECSSEGGGSMTPHRWKRTFRDGRTNDAGAALSAAHAHPALPVRRQGRQCRARCKPAPHTRSRRWMSMAEPATSSGRIEAPSLPRQSLVVVMPAATQLSAPRRHPAAIANSTKGRGPALSHTTTLPCSSTAQPDGWCRGVALVGRGNGSVCGSGY